MVLQEIQELRPPFHFWTFVRYPPGLPPQLCATKKTDMTNKFILLSTLIAYSFIVSQSLMYILSLKDVQYHLNAASYTEFRKLVDASMRANFKYVIYAALAFSLLLVILNSKTPGSLVFISSLVALIALLIDILLTLKGNLPINDSINSWPADAIPANWTSVREKWFYIFQFRQIANITGFAALLIAAVFGTK